MSPQAARTLCIVPARAGSKRVPGKNIRPVGGVPMIERSIANVLASGVATRVVVTTDDDEIAGIARASGADVPFMRPAELADDHTPTPPVIAHAIAEIGNDDGIEYDYVLVVYPTAVLLEPADLVTGVETLVRSGREAAITVCRYPAPIERAWRRLEDGTGLMRRPEHAFTRTQDLEPSYYDAGQFYVGTPTFWRSGSPVTDAQPVLIELPSWRAVDIDTEDDLIRLKREIAHGTTDR